MKYIVALTGGIGSGKSTIASIFSRFGIDVIDADIIAREILSPNTPISEAIISHFGESLIQKDGSLNRRILREHIFRNPSEKKWLDSLLQPLIQKETQRKISQASSAYVLWVVPLLIEYQLVHQANLVLVADVPTETQLIRTMARDKVSQEHVEHILSSQVSRETRLAVADDVIDNNSTTLEHLVSTISALHIHYSILARKFYHRSTIE